MEQVFKLDNIEAFKIAVLELSKNYNYASILDSNDYNVDEYSKYDFIAGLGAKSIVISSNWNDLEALLHKKCWLFGALSYDLKNSLEDLESENKDGLYFPDLCFFEPEILFTIKGNELTIINGDPEKVYNDLLNLEFTYSEWKFEEDQIQSRISKEKYTKNVLQLLNHIQLGDLFEVNFCQEFFVENVHLSPFGIYKMLRENSPTPFGNFLRLGDNFCMGASPERFIQKQGTKIVSQPIKGTIKRGNTSEEDINFKQALLADPKEQSENVMIVDLVRNDLSKVADDGTVKVEELFGAYTFPQVHQLISTVSCKSSKNPIEILKACFPMGSMTGAPKVKAMELIEHYEETKRGLYSGAVGYFDPKGDFDFNVVIRSFQYNLSRKYLSFMVGGAITHYANPQKEYEESLLKAKALFKTLLKN